MKKVWSEIVDFLSKNRVWFVVAAWLLLILTVFASLTAGVGAAINATYHPQHGWVTYDHAIIRVLYLALGLASLATLISSVALALGWRTTASASVVLFWLGLITCGTYMLTSVERGPQQFQRYVGQQRFVVPWQYKPQGSDNPGPNGFHVSLCLGSLLGTYDKACRGGTQVSMYPPKLGFAFEETSWQRRQNDIKLAGFRDGYQMYLYSIPPEGSRRGLTLTYYRRANAAGNVGTLVTCYQSGSCVRRTLMGDHILVYSTEESAINEWDAIDRKLAALVDSWAVP
jgi:uncharacterized membrane protein